LSRDLSIEDYNKLPDNFSDIVLKTAFRYWFFNKKLEDEQQRLQEKREKTSIHERENFDKSYQVQLQNELLKRDAQHRKIYTAHKNLHNALEIINKGKKELLYGTICYADCRKFGGWHNVLCVKSNNLPASFNNLAFIKYDQYCIYKTHVGEKVGFTIYPSGSGFYEFDKVIMPFCKIVWNKSIQQKQDEEERLLKRDEENAFVKFKTENRDRINELVEVSKNNPGYTQSIIDDFIDQNYIYGNELKIIEKINWLIINGGISG